jgi:hypothetical protein
MEVMNRQGVCQLHCGLAIYIEKYFNAKEELWKHSNISACKNIIFKKSSKKKPKSFTIL